MSAAWPSSLPVPLKDVDQKTVSGVARSESDFGLIQQRNRQAKTQYAQSSLSFNMSNAQLLAFKGFWKYELFNGQAFISGMTMPGGTREVRPVGEYNVQFVGPDLSRVSFDVEWQVS